MSKIALQGDASGTGTFTIAAPNSNSNPTLTLPTSSGTVVVTGGAQTIEFAAGSAASPSITFTGDTNTGIFSPGADTIAFAEGGAEIARFDSSGNFGIGSTTPNSYGRLQVKQPGTTFSSGLTVTTQADDSSLFIYDSGSSWNFLASYLSTGSYKPIVFNTGNAERMRIDSSGNVGIGTSSPSTAANGGLTLGTTSAGKSLIINSSSSGNNGLIRFIDSAGSASLEFVGGTTTMSIYGYGGRDMLFWTNGTERARITSGGALLVGTTSTGIYNQTSGGGFATLGNGETYISRQSDVPLWVNRNTSTGNLVLFYYGSTNVGNISTNGSTITFSGNALSDERHKENVEPINNALNAINAVNFVTFNYKANGQVSAGVIAQQVETIEAIKPFVINGVSEEDYKAFDYNALVGYMGKAIQELKAITDAQATRIEALEAEVAALKGQ